MNNNRPVLLIPKSFSRYCYTFLLLIAICAHLGAYAQHRETQGWFFWSHQQKLSKPFTVLADVQLRSANQFSAFETMLLRTGLQLELSDKHAVALGYAYKGDWEDDYQTYTYENRIFEQYLHQFKWDKTEMLFRARLEQRWINEDQTQFSQRARAFLSVQIPLFANPDFSKGIYAGLQNELFVNVTHKERVNNDFFDQNRTFAALGYRWSKAIDTELGYQYWYQLEKDGNHNRHVIQLQLTTQF